MRPLFFVLFAALWAAACTQPNPAPLPTATASGPLVFVGTYTEKLGHVDGKASGIYTCRFDPNTGALAIVDSATNLANPSFVCLSPDKKHLYAVGENGGKPEQPFGSVAAYSVAENGKLLKINEVPSYGVAPCHISTDRSGKFVFVANYVTGNVLSYAIKADGSLSDSLCQRQHPGQQPWAHQVLPSPDNTLLWEVDKGDDHVFVEKIGADGRLTPVGSLATAQGAGPRHLDFHPADPTLVAVINEVNSTVLIFRYDSKTNVFTHLDSLSTLPADFKNNNSCADIHFHPNGRFLYGSNRGHDSIVVYAIDPASGKLTVVDYVPCGGAVPRNFLITNDGKWLLVAHQNSGTVAAFRIDGGTGKLTPGPVSKVPTPVCLKM
jgi:6-phosphogluconolactonase